MLRSAISAITSMLPGIKIIEKTLVLKVFERTRPGGSSALGGGLLNAKFRRNVRPRHSLAATKYPCPGYWVV